MGVEAILKELVDIEGCLGGFVSKNSEVLSNSLPGLFTGEMISAAAADIARLSVLSKKAGLGEISFNVEMEKGKILSLSVGVGARLSIVCDPSASLPKVELLAGIAVDHVREVFELDPTGGIGKKFDPDEARTEAYQRFGERLGELKKILVHHVGPIGDMLFNKHLNSWLAAGPLEWQRIGAFRDSLLTELDEASAKQELASSPYWK